MFPLSIIVAGMFTDLSVPIEPFIVTVKGMVEEVISYSIPLTSVNVCCARASEAQNKKHKSVIFFIEEEVEGECCVLRVSRWIFVLKGAG